MIEVSDKWHEETGVLWDLPCDDPIVRDRLPSQTTCDRCGWDEWDHQIPDDTG